MDGTTLGICITVFLSLLAIGLCIFFGLRGFTDKLTTKITEVKDDLVMQLSGINEKIVRVETLANNIWQLASGYISAQSGTIELSLVNFGKVTVSAEPGDKYTTYIIQSEKGRLSANLIVKASKKSGLAELEIKTFGNETTVYSLGSRRLRMVIPSDDSKVCKEYLGKFLGWLDSKYWYELQTIDEFEKGIEVTNLD